MHLEVVVVQVKIARLASTIEETLNLLTIFNIHSKKSCFHCCTNTVLLILCSPILHSTDDFPGLSPDHVQIQANDGISMADVP